MAGIVRGVKRPKVKRTCRVVRPFRKLVSDRKVYRWARQAGLSWRQGLFDPVMTLWTCVYKQLQLSSARGVEDYLAALAPDQAEATRDGKDFCKARQRLPVEIFTHALAAVAAQVPCAASTLSHGLQVGIIDGTTAGLPRTKANRQYFGTARNQHGAGRCPLARLAFLVSAGVVQALHIAPYETSELEQAVALLGTLAPDWLVLADALYGSYLNLGLVRQRHSHLLCARHAARRQRKFKSLGPGEWLERWDKPRAVDCHCPELLAGLPAQQDVRILKRIVHRRGYRDYVLVLYTTLLDARTYPADDLVRLYLRRWDIELSIRVLKTQHGLGALTCKSPATVSREIYALCLCFSCVRAWMTHTGRSAAQLSHQRAVDMLLLFAIRMIDATPAGCTRLLRELRVLLASLTLEQRPRPPQPRAIARITQRYPLLTCSRAQWRARYHAA
jgi:hypothetical protein